MSVSRVAKPHVETACRETAAGSLPPAAPQSGAHAARAAPTARAPGMRHGAYPGQPAPSTRAQTSSCKRNTPRFLLLQTLQSLSEGVLHSSQVLIEHCGIIFRLLQVGGLAGDLHALRRPHGGGAVRLKEPAERAGARGRAPRLVEGAAVAGAAREERVAPQEREPRLPRKRVSQSINSCGAPRTRTTPAPQTSVTVH